MSTTDLIHIEELAAQLPREDQLRLIERLARRLQLEQRPNSESLLGIWRDAVPVDFDVESAVREIRSESARELIAQ